MTLKTSGCCIQSFSRMAKACPCRDSEREKLECQKMNPLKINDNLRKFKKFGKKKTKKHIYWSLFLASLHSYRQIFKVSLKRLNMTCKNNTYQFQKSAVNVTDWQLPTRWSQNYTKNPTHDWTLSIWLMSTWNFYTFSTAKNGMLELTKFWFSGI